MEKTKGMVIVISAPSGAGKSTICHQVLKKMPEMIFSVSVTTRQARQGEVEGKDYYFLSEDNFTAMVMRNELLEWAFVHDHYYGTPRRFLEETINSGKDIVLDIDVQGGKRIKQIYPECVPIFIMPPSWQVLEERLRSRAQDEEETIKKRLENAKGEFNYIGDYNYLVINDNLEDAINMTVSIIKVERIKIPRMLDQLEKFKQQ